MMLARIRRATYAQGVTEIHIPQYDVKGNVAGDMEEAGLREEAQRLLLDMVGVEIHVDDFELENVLNIQPDWMRAEKFEESDIRECQDKWRRPKNVYGAGLVYGFEGGLDGAH